MPLEVSFFLIPENDFEQLLIASKVEETITTKRVFLFKKKLVETVDHLWGFLERNAKKQKEYEFAASVFLDLHSLVEDKGFDFYDFEIVGASNEFRDLRDSSGALFDASGAAKTLTQLNKFELRRAEIENYLKDEYELNEADGDLELGVVAVQAAFETLKSWMSSVKANKVGIFMFG